MLDRFEGALDSVKEATMVDVMVATGLAATVLIIANNGIALYQSIFGARRMNKLDLIAIASERESALHQLQEAQSEVNSDSLGSALGTIDAAITDFQRALSRNSDLVELGNNKKILAKLFYTRAEIKTLQNETSQAEHDLLTAIAYRPEYILAHNLLSHLYLHQIHSEEKAKKHLSISLSLNPHQIYARFYLSMLKNDLPAMNTAAEKILQLLFQQFEAESHHENHLNHPAFTEMLATTPSVTLSFILVNWLDIRVDREKNPHGLLSVANAIQAILNNNYAVRNTRLRVMMQECRISALLKIAELKPLNSQFNEDEIILRNHCTSKCIEDDTEKFFLEYHAAHLDKAVTSLFIKGTDTDYLPKYQKTLGELIVGWARHGLLCDDNHALILQLTALLSDSLLRPHDNELNLKISALAESKEMIEHFILHHIKGKGWKPWLTVVPSSNGMLSLLVIACEEQHVKLAIYHRISDNEKLLALTTQPHQAGQPVLRLLYDAESTSDYSFKLLQEIAAPADLFRWMALRECWQLLKHDDDLNAYALSVLGERQLASLPETARLKLADKTLMPLERTALIGALDAYIQHHEGIYQEDKAEAKKIRSIYPDKEKTNTYSRFFAVVGAAAVTLGAAYAFTRNCE